MTKFSLRFLRKEPSSSLGLPCGKLDGDVVSSDAGDDNKCGAPEMKRLEIKLFSSGKLI